MLTRKQHELLMFINERLSSTGVSPSFDEMKEALNLRSKSGIHRLVTALEERGFIRRLAHRARALEVLKLPEQSVPAASPAITRASVIRPDFAGRRPSLPPPSSTETRTLPLYGRIAAGTPIEALRDQSSFVEVPTTLLDNGEHYAL